MTVSSFFLRAVAEVGEQLKNAVAVVALDKDFAVFCRASDTTAGFESLAEVFEVVVGTDKS